MKRCSSATARRSTRCCNKVIPETIDSKAGTLFPKRLRIWSAACSTGQEPYSIAMLLAEMLPDVHEWDINILGTDISDEAVARASRGWYATHEIERGLSPARLHRFFQQENNGWRVKDSLRALCSFERRNLLDPNSAPGQVRRDLLPQRGDLFHARGPQDLFLRLATALTPEGWMFVGSQESLRDLGPQFAPQQHCRAILSADAGRRRRRQSCDAGGNAVVEPRRLAARGPSPTPVAGAVLGRTEVFRWSCAQLRCSRPHDRIY